MATSKPNRSKAETICILCKTIIPSGKTYRMVFDDAGMHIGDRCHIRCPSGHQISANQNQQAVIEKRLAEYEADERLSYPTANVAINAPLALVQVDLAARVNTLKWVLKIMKGEL